MVKPQSAFFEAYGSAGIAVLERTIAACRAAGALVLLDVKRGDIGSTMAAYARAYLDPASPLAADAITVSPYLGVGSLAPAFDAAAAHGNGVFVLALTSNPEGGQVQLASLPGGRSVAQAVVDELAGRNRGTAPLGSLGVVVGATATPPRCRSHAAQRPDPRARHRCPRRHAGGRPAALRRCAGRVAELSRDRCCARDR